MIKKVASKFSNRTIFLFDFCGALLTSLSYIAIYLFFKDNLGFSNYIVYVHLGLAIIYAVYSFTMYSIKPAKWQEFLKVIAFANLLFCGVAGKFFMAYYDNLTTLGKIYLAVEIIIVLQVALFELYFIEYRKKRETQP